MPHVETRRVVPLTFGETWAFCTDVESFPEYMNDVVSVKIIEAGENWQIQKWDARVRGVPFRWTEKNVHDLPARRIDYRQTEGDLKQFEGSWTFREVDGGTEVTLTCDFEFGMPMVASLLNPVAKLLLRDNLVSMLDGVSKKAQGG